MDMDSRRLSSHASAHAHAPSPAPAAHRPHPDAHDPRHHHLQHQQHPQPYPHHPPPPPPFAPQQQHPPPPQQQHPQHAYQQQQQQQQQQQHAPPTPHYPPQGHSQVPPLGPPPSHHPAPVGPGPGQGQPPPSPHHAQHHQPPPHAHPQQQQQQQQHAYSSAPGLPPQGPALPPIQPAAYAPAASASEQHSLPPFRPQHSSAPPSHDTRDPGPEYHQHQQQQYNHGRSGHATPAPVNRAFSHDSGNQRSPITPAGPQPPYQPHTAGQDGHQPPVSQPMDHAAHHGYPPNGAPVQHGLPTYHHEQPPPNQYMAPAMESHPAYAPQGQPMYPASYGPASNSMYATKRKQMRATQACEQCRQRKQKCDEGNPCSFCKENNLSCQYRDTPPAKTDKNMEKLLSMVESVLDSNREMSTKMDAMDARWEAMNARLRRVEQEGHEARHHRSPSARQSSHSGHQARSNYDNHVKHSNDGNRRDHHDHTTAGAEHDEHMTTDELSGRTGSGSREHRTAPHKLLLLWPTIMPLLKQAGLEKFDPGYVMQAEDRGLLRLHTRGEGIDENDGTQAGGPASPANSDEPSPPEDSTGSTPFVDGRWGTGFPSTPNSDHRRSDYTGAGGLKPNGELDLDHHTVNSLYDSYMRNLHIMHPFLDKRRVRRMFDNFTKRYSHGRPRAAPFAVSTNTDLEQRPLKRQRSNGSSGETINGPETEFRREPIERSPTNCIIFLVMALGKICLHKEPLPAIVQDSKAQVNSMIAHQLSGNGVAGSPLNIKPSPMSPNVTPITQSTPLSDPGHRSRRSSVEGPSPPRYAGPRNIDVVPGIAYFAKAAEILGEQGDGNDLVHAQMFLLAGLYKGQLARVQESMSWITMAGRAVMTLLDRYKLYNSNYWDTTGDVRAQLEDSKRRIKDTRQSLIVLASWSCLQLESDILAEMKLPASGIQDIEGRLILPDNLPDDEEESYKALEPYGHPGGRHEETSKENNRILLYYTSQLFLRRKLNEVHRQMYGTDTANQSIQQIVEMLQSHGQMLDGWRQCLPPDLQWQDDDLPPEDILAARLRAKYWGARYVINRPFLDYGLHIIAGLKSGHTVEDLSYDGRGNKRDKAEVQLFKAIQRLGEDEVWRASERCVIAARKSTVAFDGVKGRLIVTNIHGTAHAQFGNMLVLTAVVKSPFFSYIAKESEYHELLKRTIAFLRRLAPISPTCKADCGILEKFSMNLFKHNQDLKEVYANEAALDR